VCVDHSFAREVHAFKVDAEARGILVHTRGFELLEPVSEHPQAARRVRTHPASSHSASHR
jgi:hypothetical protein